MVLTDSNIQKFFKDQTIFLTGGSGFVGKVLIEKLLRVCGDLKKIYVLLRPKKGKTPEERFEEFFNYPCFDFVKSQNAQLLEKVCLITGDCQVPDLGLSPRDKSILIDETTCVIHAAANVKFDQTLKEAACNVRAIKEMLQLSRHMTKLRVFVFVSTAFSHCIDTYAEEKFYEPPIKAENLLILADAFDDDTLQAMTPHLLGKWPNTYVYTKCVSEDLFKTAGEYLPIAVVRPAIKEPMPGWVDNFYGAVGITTGGALGVITSLHADPNATAPLVPVDYVSNCILAAACRREKCEATTIYNFTGEESNQLTWTNFYKQTDKHYWKYPLSNAIWYKQFQMRKCKIWHNIYVFLSLTLPAYFADLVLFCLGKPTFVVANCKRLNKMLDLISYFTIRNWSWKHTNVTELWNEMSDGDKKLFQFNMRDIDWDSYYLNAIYGGRMYLLKETIDNLPRAKRKQKILFVANYTITALLYFLLYKFAVLILRLFL